MARHVAYRCHHCHTWSEVIRTEDIEGVTIVYCRCTNPKCQAVFSKSVAHHADIAPPVKSPGSHIKMPEGVQMSF